MNSRKEVVLYGFLILFILFVIADGIMPDETNAPTQLTLPNNDLYQFERSSLIIEFTGESNGSVIATTMQNETEYNRAFNRAFNQDLDDISVSFSDIFSVRVERWFEFTDVASLNVNYYNNATDQYRKDALVQIQDFLESKWYARSVSIS